MAVYIDANVLIAFLVASHPGHEQVVNFLAGLMDSGDDIVVSPQVISESFRVMTHGRFFKERIDAAAFKEMISEFLSAPEVQLLIHGETAMLQALNAAVLKNITSSGIYDMNHYGTMREHGITRLATFNTKHFAELPGIELVSIP